VTSRDIGSLVFFMTQEEKYIGSFDELSISEDILKTLTQKGFKNPTPIQHQVIKSAIEGKDVVGIAQTGTGKTLAFGIPMIQRINENGGQGLVLVPTRELALQVEYSIRQIGATLGLRLAVIMGGVPQRSQLSSLRNNPHIIVATPGRLFDIMGKRQNMLNKVNIVTLDEADRMLDVGFLPQIKKILQTIPKERQTMLFSATMPKSISMLASAFMKMPLRIEIAPQGTAPKNVEQEIFVVSKDEKMRLLDLLLQQYKNDTTLVFSRTRYGAKRVARDIRSMGHTATEIHSNRSQVQRKMALDGFKRGKFRIMVATDIASRGIDVKDITLIINFDLPDNSEDYVHRIGRTGRVGRYGKAISFVTSSQKADVRKIERLIRKSLPILSLPTLPPEREKIPYRDDLPSTRKRYDNRRSSPRPYQGSRNSKTRYRR
jgi:ATP-dependent RNA helicase RhlE